MPDDAQQGGAPVWTLRSVDAGESLSLRLDPPGPLRVGRLNDCDLHIPEEHVSRRHALIERRAEPERPEESGWTLTDTNSRHGVWINGVRVQPGAPVPLRHGDVVSLGGRTLRVICDALDASSESARFHTRNDDQTGQSISALAGAADARRQQRWLQLLIDCAQTLREAETEAALGEALLTAAASVADTPNIAILGPMEQDARVDVLAHRGDIFEGGQLRVSRTLLRRAASGEPVRLSGEDSTPTGALSILNLGIDEAVCVPLTLGPGVAGYLYADRRGVGASALTPEACECLIGLGRLASMALADLKRRDLERRQARVEADLHAAGEAHRFILPPREGRFGRIRYRGESRPGASTLGGDFFDAVALPDGRVGVALGDVSGKGVAASVLTTSAQGFLHAALLRRADPARAVADLNAYLVPRRRSDRFVTLWVGVFDPNEASLTYVDAGHGHAAMLGVGAEPCLLREGGGPPVGLTDELDYTAASVPLPPGGRVLIVSDGLVEQQSPNGEEFTLARVLDLLSEVEETTSPVDAVFEALTRHAQSDSLADDATCVLIDW